MTKNEALLLMAAITVGGIIAVIVVSNPISPETQAQIQNEKIKTEVLRAEHYIEGFVYIKDKNTYVCYATHPNAIDTLISIQCTEKVLKVIQSRR